MDYRRTALEEVETKLYGEARGRRHGGFRPRSVEQHLSIVGAVLTEASKYRPGDLSSSVGKRFVLSLADLFCPLFSCVVQRVQKGGGPPPPKIVNSEERRMTGNAP